MVEVELRSLLRPEFDLFCFLIVKPVSKISASAIGVKATGCLLFMKRGDQASVLVAVVSLPVHRSSCNQRRWRFGGSEKYRRIGLTKFECRSSCQRGVSSDHWKSPTTVDSFESLHFRLPTSAWHLARREVNDGQFGPLNRRDCFRKTSRTNLYYIPQQFQNVGYHKRKSQYQVAEATGRAAGVTPGQSR